MANHWFQFRQFRIGQESCAMKVCTDACIQGAYMARQERWKAEAQLQILDIGTGTGLLALMLAQELPQAQIDAIEIDAAAYSQAMDNISKSPWSERITLFHGDARTFAFPEKYDFIITNPPFFENDLKSGDPGKNRAKHATDLSYEELLCILDERLHSDGCFCTLLPAHRFPAFCRLAERQLFYPEHVLQVKQTPKHDPFRSIGMFSHQKLQAVKTRSLTITDTRHEYTPEFVHLLKDYYLKFRDYD